MYTQSGTFEQKLKCRIRKLSQYGVQSVTIIVTLPVVRLWGILVYRGMDCVITYSTALLRL